MHRISVSRRVAAGLMFLWGAVACVEAATQQVSLQRLDAYIQQAQQDWRVPGVAVGVIQNGAVIWSKGYGAREIGKQPRVDSGTLFEIGSLTKAMAAASLGILVDEGKLSWDDPVIEHLPSFRVADPWLSRNITVRDLVAGRSGVEGGAYAVVPMDTKQVLRTAVHVPSRGAFRDSLLYSNVMYDIAGELVAEVSGMSWGEFVERRIFQPLRMGSSRASADTAGIWDAAYLAPSMYGQAPAGRAGIENAPDANVAMPHWHTPQGLKALPWQISQTGGSAAGSVVANLDDMLKWVQFNLGDGPPLLRTSTLSELHTPQIFVRKSPSNSFSLVQRAIDQVSPSESTAAYAMGWFVQDYRKHRMLNHGGALLGGLSVIAMIPERDIAVVVLANSYGRDGMGLMTWAIALRALDVLLQVEPHDWSGELLNVVKRRDVESAAEQQRVEQSRLRGTRPSLPLQSYVGEYENAEFGRIRVDQVGEGLALRLPGVFDWRLEHWHNDTFRLHVSTSGVDLMQFFLTFQVDQAAKVRSFDGGWGVLGGRFVPTVQRPEPN
ncbi:serine hydrolase [Steroidobacter sp.]|uniref:serine hydrolase n=1 Tax=Steroidobacter sp. TaxID=1978227 RepID=UPI001A525335|nr:serine hydrolase [Steroidobacter sp.]MBL8270016.1 serine hydrolase [Steroidobacter sp.]